MHWIIDRFESNTVVLENTGTLEIIERNRSELPPGAREGDAFVEDASGKLIPDRAETEGRAERVRERFNRLTKG